MRVIMKNKIYSFKIYSSFLNVIATGVNLISVAVLLVHSIEDISVSSVHQVARNVSFDDGKNNQNSFSSKSSTTRP